MALAGFGEDGAGEEDVRLQDDWNEVRGVLHDDLRRLTGSHGAAGPDRSAALPSTAGSTRTGAGIAPHRQDAAALPGCPATRAGLRDGIRGSPAPGKPGCAAAARAASA